ncbi:MAG: hypothetical protein AAGD92_13035 [Pseudomonadota bacterium]
MRRQLILATLATLTAGAADAQVVATQHVEKEVAVAGGASGPQIRRIVAETVAPGEEVIYSLRFKNEDDESAENLILVMPVPGEVSYVEGSVAGAGANVSFSADGGQTYVARGRLTVVEDGVVRPAKDDEITHIRWTLSDPLPPLANGEVSYRGVLK